MGDRVALGRWAGIFFALASAAWTQNYTADKSGPVPAQLAPGIAQALDQSGFQVRKDGRPYCQIWLRSKVPAASAPSRTADTLANVTLSNISAGTLVGVIRFDAAGVDRRGENIPPGIYTLRYAIMPANEQHQGVARQRDFLLLTSAAEDRDLNATPELDALVAGSRKVSGTSHPAVLSVWKAKTDSPGFSQQGDSDWVLEATVGDTAIAIVVAGTVDR